MKTKWEIVEHNWSDTSIYEQDGRLICTRCIEDEATEENKDELGEEVLRDFNLIVLAPEMRKLLIKIYESEEIEGDYLIWKEIEEILNRAK